MNEKQNVSMEVMPGTPLTLLLLSLDIVIMKTKVSFKTINVSVMQEISVFSTNIELQEQSFWRQSVTNCMLFVMKIANNIREAFFYI